MLYMFLHIPDLIIKLYFFYGSDSPLNGQEIEKEQRI